MRIVKSFTTEATALHVEMMGKEVTITSQTKDEPLNKAKWLLLIAHGFTTEQEAHQFGTRLASMLQIAALSSRHGVDIGENKPTSWVSEAFARSHGLLKENERIAPNIHGLTVLPDDDLTRFPSFKAEMTVTADPEQMMSALRELGGKDDIDLGAAANGVRLLNLALMTSEPLAQMVLGLSAVEELGQKEKWSDAQTALIRQLATDAERSALTTEAERAEVARAIRTGLFPLSLRQGVLRLLACLGLQNLKTEWDRLYGLRSGTFHGTARLSDDQLNQAAFDTVTLCGQIILALIAAEGITVPSIAARHFNLSTSATAPG